ncbi:MAG: response regulator [Nitrospira sp.]|nr:response regulator [Nitrospira sp.]
MPLTILVVDDCATTRRLLSLYLKSDGYQVSVAVNGLNALEHLARSPVDVILTDLNMPLMDGLSLTKAVKQDQQLSAIPILMLTTESADNEREQGYRAGVAGYLVKPVSQQQLMQEVRRVIGLIRP